LLKTRTPLDSRLIYIQSLTDWGLPQSLKLIGRGGGRRKATTLCHPLVLPPHLDNNGNSFYDKATVFFGPAIINVLDFGGYVSVASGIGNRNVFH